MSDTAMPAGWYHAQGDPVGTQRYWDGQAWQGAPTAVAESHRPQQPARVPGTLSEQAKATFHYGPFDWFLEGFRNYANFSGRARRAEYWWFSIGVLVLLVIGGVCAEIVDGLIGALPFIAFFLASIIPAISSTVRRLHDIGRSGWWYLLNFVPLVSIIVLVMLMVDGHRSANKWGPSPKYR